MLIGFNACAMGFSHKANDKPCQDAAIHGLNREKSFGIAVVADGHGGEKYFRSDVGSKLAVATATAVIRELLVSVSTDVDLEKNLRLVEQKIIKRWRDKVERHIQRNPWTPAELALCKEKNIDLEHLRGRDKLVTIYGTTLVAAAVTDSFWFALQIGDGQCALIDGDGNRDDSGTEIAENAKVAIPPDEEQGFGLTQSLCASDAADKFRHSFGRGAIGGITVATDGVVDSFLPDAYLKFTIRLRDNFIRDAKASQTELKGWLPTLSEQGSRDDVAIAGIFMQFKGE
jgi:serine/threonine protein phosphatase PrpC